MQTAGVWHEVLRAVDDGRLVAAVASWLRTPDARWWPTPGQILVHAPAPARQLTERHSPFPECKLGRHYGRSGDALVAKMDSMVATKPLGEPCGSCADRALCWPSANLDDSV